MSSVVIGALLYLAFGFIVNAWLRFDFDNDPMEFIVTMVTWPFVMLFMLYMIFLDLQDAIRRKHDKKRRK